MSKPSDLAAWTHRKKHKPQKDATWTVPNNGDDPPNGNTLQKQIEELKQASKGKGKRKGIWGGKKTKKNKNSKTKRYTKRYISKLNKRNKTRKRRNSH